MKPGSALRRGLVGILAATGIAGVLGYVIQLTAGILLVDAQQYVAFAAYWSLLYLLVSAMSGVQQEVTRASAPRRSAGASDAAGTVLGRYSMPLIGALLLVVLAITVAQILTVGPSRGMVTGAALLVGSLGYLAVAILSGVVYGLHLWAAAALLTLVDAVLRAALVVGALLLGAPSAVLEVLVSVPFVLAAGLVWLLYRGRVSGRLVIDVDTPRLLRNTTHTVVAATAMGLMITGLPLLLQVAFSTEPASVTAALIFTITVTRAPIVVPLQALQSYLVARLRDGGGLVPRRLAALLAAALGATGVLALAGGVIGPPVIAVITSGRFEVTPYLVSAVVAGAALVGLLTVTGAALLSAGRHAAYSVGWIASAVLTVVFLLLPGRYEERLVMAMIIAPLAGVTWHCLVLWRAALQRGRAQGTDDAVQ
ncbi:hypothetical protein H9651_06225 [Microbacterium sp. Sa4CUA7]|uniref:Polysaccharide biosynthesis protein n=1 Tax=Microbacterium pullorum TaxID=2762236 RepID=A0ABR8S182_9MICO|nr:hypothetical protein [Microbacterium pullorum]MBD7957227.1 hypothetical protein [Microbacterium pullorum]